jgi:hypothetical protein
MADVKNFTNPLGGHEVVADILGQIRRKLLTDCNLRMTDGYSGGYSGEVKISLKLNAVRITPVEMTVSIAQSLDVEAPPVESFAPEDIETVEISETISIPTEENLVAVRDRIFDNSEKTMAAEAENAAAPQEEEPEDNPRAKRKYTRRAAMAGAMTDEPSF